MNGRADLDGDAVHQATQESLPWLLNGTLAGEQLEAAHAHLRACSVCRADLASLRYLGAAGAAPDPQCDPERALARLRIRIDASGQAPADGPSGAPPLPMARRAANDPRWLRRAALFQCGVIVLLAALLAWPGDAPDAYRGLGAAPAAQGQVVLLFRPETPERELRRIVRASGARIIDGPTVTDAYVLAMPRGQLASLLARLRTEPAVLLAEPLGTERQP